MDLSSEPNYNEQFYNYHINTAHSLDAVVSLIIDITAPKSVVDFGCSVGAALSCFKAKGVVEILGVDGYWVKDDQLMIAHDELFRHDFNESGFLSLPKKYDLAMSTEVAEHLYESNADEFVATLVNASDVVVFSSAIPGQGGEHHVNEQYPEYWIEKFAKHDYRVFDCLRESLWNNENVDFWYKQNLLLFCKEGMESGLKLPDAVEPRYDIIHPKQYEQKLLQLYGFFKGMYEAGNYSGIIALSFLKNYDYSVNLFLGLAYSKRMDYKRCAEYLEKFLEISAISYFHAFHLVYNTLGNAYFNLQDYRKAEYYLNKCIQTESELKTSSIELLGQIEAIKKVLVSQETDPHTQALREFLAEIKPFMEQLDDLPFETAAELYDMLGKASGTATSFIGMIDPELRVELCRRQDEVLERIVDVMPPFELISSLTRIYTPMLQDCRRWENFELMKDCGLAGYMLAKEIGATPIMLFGTKPEDYPYMSLLPGMEILCNDSEPDGEVLYHDHLKSSHDEMDILLLYGMYSHSIYYLDNYRKERPDGKVYCALDMNSYWMETTPWGSAEAKRFAGKCDLIATSCRSMRDALNRRRDVSFPCRWFTNGFYNPTRIPVIADSEVKENVILTVGRIGTHQKNNEEMLAAFAASSDALEGWTLRLVGSVEPGFQTFIDNYFEINPHLRDRLVFTGPITDKSELYGEYARAKVFILSSRQEGFPNVYAEALFHGCMFVTSDIDAADDIINYGDLGAKYPGGNANALADTLVEVCRKANRTGMVAHIPKALEYARKYYDWHRNAKKLAYMLFS